MIKVFVNGTFDILHPGHVAMLTWARSLGDCLMVAIDSDRRVRELKGASRPFFNQQDRVYMLNHLRCVDQVCVFDSDDELCRAMVDYGADIMVKGSDYRGQPIVGQELIPRIEFFERIHEHSTTKTIQHLADR